VLVLAATRPAGAPDYRGVLTEAGRASTPAVVRRPSGTLSRPWRQAPPHRAREVDAAAAIQHVPSDRPLGQGGLGRQRGLPGGWSGTGDRDHARWADPTDEDVGNLRGLDRAPHRQQAVG